MSALSSGSEERSVAASNLGFVTPMLTFLTGGLSHQISWDIDWGGIALLIGCAAIGFLLQVIPRSSRSWDPPPDSSQATLKQSIAVARLFVMIGLIVLPIVVLSTGKPVLDRLPAEIEQYISRRMNPPTLQAPPYFVFAPEQAATLQPTLYAGKFVVPPGMSATPPVPTIGSGATAAPLTGKLYVLQTTQIVHDLVINNLVPGMYQIVGILVVLIAIFTGAIFFMEVFGGVMWEQRQRPAAEGP